MNCNPLAYESLKSVLLRMDPNLRIKLSQRIPGIRTAEKSVPLFTRFLHLTQNGTQFNTIQYSVKCVQPNPLILVDSQIMEKDVKKGVDVDLTRYGNPDYSTIDKIFDGDIVLPRTEADVLRRDLAELQLEQLDELLRMRMDDLTESPGTHLVFKIINEDDDKVIVMEHLDYSRRLAEAAKYMNEKLLGGRNHAVRTDNFYDGDGVLRLPVGLRVKPYYWSIKYNMEEICKTYEGIFDKDALPIAELCFVENAEVFINPENYQHPMVKSTEYLEIYSDDEEADMLETILGITNLSVHFECRVSIDDIKTAVDTWIMEGRDVGHDVSFGIEKKEDFKILFDAYQNLPNAQVEKIPARGCPEFPNVITFPLSLDKELSIFCHATDKEILNFYDPWQFNILVTPKGHHSGIRKPSSFLFAYSTDFDSETVKATWDAFAQLANGVNWADRFALYGCTRFDRSVVEPIDYETSVDYCSNHVNYNLPDPSLGYQNASVGSNVFSVIENYFKDPISVPYEGSVILILLKRYPNESDISKIVDLIRQNQVVLHAMISGTPSGGTQSQALYNIATKTNGLGAYEHDEQFQNIILDFPIYSRTVPVYAANAQISGKGKMVLPPFSCPANSSYFIAVTRQDHIPLGTFQFLTFAWYNSNSRQNAFFMDNVYDAKRDDNGTLSVAAWPFDPVVYNMTFEYTYGYGSAETLQFRIYGESTLNPPLPYAD